MTTVHVMLGTDNDSGEARIVGIFSDRDIAEEVIQFDESILRYSNIELREWVLNRPHGEIE